MKRWENNKIGREWPQTVAARLSLFFRLYQTSKPFDLSNAIGIVCDCGHAVQAVSATVFAEWIVRVIKKPPADLAILHVGAPWCALA
jgi:hypothetical protein